MASTWSKCASLFRSQKIVKNLRILGKLSIPTGVTICALPVFGCKKPIQEVGERLQSVDRDKLSHKYMIKNASSGVVDSACALLNQTVRALIDAEEDYNKAIENLFVLLDLNLQILGQSQQEDKIWDEILAARATLGEAKKTRQELQDVLSSTVKIMNAVAETAFIAGEDYSGIVAGERLNFALVQLKPYETKSKESERKLVDIEVRTISETTKQKKEREREEEETREKAVEEQSEEEKASDEEELLGNESESVPVQETGGQ